MNYQTTGKRKGREYDPKLRRVAQALENVTRIGVSFASSTSNEFPLPALAFKDEEDELHLPIGQKDLQRIKARAHTGRTAMWAIDGDVLETRNTRWYDYLEGRLNIMRKTLGVAPTAAVKITLSKIVIAKAGARILRPHHGGRRSNGIFGRLIVVLPGGFEGGEVTVEIDEPVPNDEETKEEEAAMTITKRKTIMWNPSTRDNTYDISFAVMYDHCGYTANAVTSGMAVCLIYDLVTTTPSDVPLFGGAKAVQDAVDLMLTEFFNVVPEAVIKRLKISSDAWRTINQFGAERHFAYIVSGKSFDTLDVNERKIAASLAMFCAQNRGHYVLYLCKTFCSRFSSAQKQSTERSAFVDDHANEMNVTLMDPWIKHDRTSFEDYEKSGFTPIHLRHVHHVAPLGRVETLPLHAVPKYMDDAKQDIVEKLYGGSRNVGIYTSWALVVQPVSIELSQIATLPIGCTVHQLHKLLPESREKALKFARSVVYHRSTESTSMENVDDLAKFIEIVVVLNDCKLFKDLVGTVKFERFTNRQRVFHNAIEHFGWDQCVHAVVKRLQTLSTARGRINLMNSVLSTKYERPGKKEYLDRLFDTLVSCHPWQDKTTEKCDVDSWIDQPSQNDFTYLLMYARRSSVDRMKQVASVHDDTLMVKVVAPALIQLVRKYPQSQSLRSVLQHVRELFKPLLAELRHQCYSKVFIFADCAKCRELEDFVNSKRMETTIECANAVERQHIEHEIESSTRFPAIITVEQIGTSALRLVKTPRAYAGSLLNYAQERAKELVTMLAIHPPPRQGRTAREQRLRDYDMSRISMT